MRRRISTGSPFEAEFAYSRAVVRGDWCFVAGTTGYDYATMTMPEPAVDAGAAPPSRRSRRTLAEAGFAIADVVRVRYTITDAALARRDRAGAARGAWRGAAGGDDGGGGAERAGDEGRDRGHRVSRLRRIFGARCDQHCGLMTLRRRRLSRILDVGDFIMTRRERRVRARRVAVRQRRRRFGAGDVRQRPVVREGLRRRDLAVGRGRHRAVRRARPLGSGKIDYDTGYLLGAAVGYDYSQNFACELEYAYRNAGTSGDTDGDVTTNSFMLNIALQVRPDGARTGRFTALSRRRPRHREPRPARERRRQLQDRQRLRLPGDRPASPTA